MTHLQPIAINSHHLKLLKRLADELDRGREVLVGNDSQTISDHVTAQETICRQWTGLSLGGAADVSKEDGGVSHSEARPPCSEALRMEILQVEERLQHLLRVHRALLRRAKRKITILTNLLESGRLTYSPPPGISGSTSVTGVE